MSRPLSIATVVEKNRISSDVPFLVAVEVDVTDPGTGNLVETLYLVLNTEEIVFQGHTYYPASFDIEMKQEAGQQHSVQLAIKDYSKAIQARMQAYGGGVGFVVRVMVLNAGALDLPAEIVEHYDVVGAEAANYICTFKLGTENALSKTFPRRRQTKNFCQWRYKGVECGYTGSMPSCDLTLNGTNGCAAHNNIIRFGALPGIQTRDNRYG